MSRLFSPIAPLASQWQMIVSTAAPCLSVCLSAVCRSWPRRFLSCVAARALPTPSSGSPTRSTSVVPIPVLPAWHWLPAGTRPRPRLGSGRGDAMVLAGSVGPGCGEVHRVGDGAGGDGDGAVPRKQGQPNPG